MGTQGLPKNAHIAGGSQAEPTWFALHTSARHEKRVATHLASRGIDHFLPVYREVRQWNDRRATVEAPLFPGYVFVNIGRDQQLPVLQVPGVARIVGFNGTPAPVEPTEIEALRKGSASGIHFEPHPFLKVGNRARVREGAFQGLEGIIVGRKDQERFVISIDLLMKSVALEIDTALLEIMS